MRSIAAVWFWLNAIRVWAWDPKYEKQTLNVRTVLFRDVDSCKSCWNKQDLDLLMARRHMQELVPRKIPKDFPLLLRYIQLAMGTVKSKTPPEDYPVMKMAMYDVFGGYLKAVVIPMLNEAYYAGNVGYGVTAELHSIYGQIMTFLGTDGGTWSSPCDMRKIPTKVVPLPVTMCKHKESCDALLGRAPPRPEVQNATQATVTTGTSSNNMCSDTTKPFSPIPLPYLDDKSYPNAIAIPFKDHSLFSLMTMCSAFILPKYYILAMRCLTGPSYNSKDIVNFNHEFHRWIVSTVQPHLIERDRWYPGFGGVMRIVETMNEKGLTVNDVIPPDLTPSNDSVPCNVSLDVPCDYPWWLKLIIILVIVLLVLMLLICVICCVIFCIRRRRKMQDLEECSGSAEVPPGMLSTLVSLYFGLKDSVKEDNGQRNGSSEDELLHSTESDKQKNKKRDSENKTKYYASDMDTADELSEGPSGILGSSTSLVTSESAKHSKKK